MKRRDLIKALGAVALSGSIGARGVHAQPATPTSKSPESDVPKGSLPKVVAGIAFVDSKIATEATKLAQEASPPFLFNHAARTFLFGAQKSGRERGRAGLPAPQIQGRIRQDVRQRGAAASAWGIARFHARHRREICS